MTKYDPAVIRKFADRLYAEATRIVVFDTIIGAVVGALLGFWVGDYGKKHDPKAWDQTILALLGLLLLGLFGYAIGRERSFKLRLEAQMALCQVQIEENTRKVTSAFERPSEASSSA